MRKRTRNRCSTGHFVYFYNSSGFRLIKIQFQSSTSLPARSPCFTRFALCNANRRSTKQSFVLASSRLSSALFASFDTSTFSHHFGNLWSSFQFSSHTARIGHSSLVILLFFLFLSLFFFFFISFACYPLTMPLLHSSTTTRPTAHPSLTGSLFILLCSSASY